jgi:hypothetical protein
MVLSETFEVPYSAAHVWGELTSDDALWWCRALRSVRWTSPRPFGVGTTRSVHTILSATVLDEHFFRWEEGRRKSFYAAKLSAPIFASLAEDYLVEPTSESSCSFTWTIAAEPRQIARLATPLNRLLLSTLFHDTRKHYGLR